MISPPTDSLYKFLAISGLVTVGWSVAFPWDKHLEYELKVAEVKAEVQKSKLKVERLDSQYKSLLDEESKLQAERSEQDRKLKLAAIEGRKQKLYIEMLEAQQPVDERVEALKVLQDALRSYYLMGLVSTIAGLILAVAGFFLWYGRVQRYVDVKLRQDTEKET